MTQHLTREAIESYVARRGKVDEILAAAEHLDVCFDCRDVAAAIVDDGAGEISHVRERMTSFVKRQASRTFVPWVFGAVVLVLVVALVLLLSSRA
jgi:hypothetical protein